MAGMIPPWIQPADEANYLGRGLQIGEQMTAEDAQAAYRAQQLQLEQANAMRQAQQDALQQKIQEQQQARLEKQFQIEAQQAAQKSQALLGYQKAIQEGTDPLQAILQYGPAMGQPVTSAAAAQRAILAEQKRAQQFAPAAVQAFPVLDPDTKEPIPGFIAVPSPTGKGMTVRLTKAPADVTPKEAFNMLSKVPELLGTTPGVTNIVPFLQKRASEMTNLVSKASAKATDQVLPMPATQKDAMVGSVYMTKVGPRRWNGEHFVPVQTQSAAATETDTGDEE